MKTKVLSLIWLLALSTFLLAQAPPEIGLGQFDAELGICSHNGTVYLVYNTQTHVYAVPAGDIVLMYRSDDGEVWNSRTVASNVTGLTKPTISVNDQEIIVTYVNGSDTYMVISTNQGDHWHFTSLGPSFESSPYVENTGDQLRKYSLELPYPQRIQDEFLCNDDSDNLKTYHTVVESGVDPHGFPWRFYGHDVIYGAYRTNGDLWIRQTNGGENGGWPTFHGLAMTAGQVKVYPGGGSYFPEEQIFRGGLIENAPCLEIDNTRHHRENSILLGPNHYDEKYIVYVDVSGTTADVYLGVKTNAREVQLPVYSEYPTENLGEPLYTNTFTIRDTLWTYQHIYDLDNQTIFTHNELWIKGTFATHQTWASASDIKIIGDILLAGTLAGMNPYENQNDSVSLISEKKIEIKYGYRSPANGLRYHLCRSDSEPIMIYASLSALDEDEGRFTFEYQHPHPSVPDVRVNNVLYTNIDLHRRQFPPATPTSWYQSAPEIDYPWYNPLWPERMPYLQRGILQIWGSINERINGFIHRNYSDADYPNPTGIWDIENDLCGGSSAPNAVDHTDPVLGIRLNTQNYPGASGGGVGYKKSHYGNIHRSFTDDYNFKFGIVLEEIDTTGDDTEDDDVLHYSRFPQAIRSKLIARNGSNALYAVNNKLIFENGADIESIYPFGQNDTAIIKQIEWADDQRVMIVRYDAANTAPYSLHIINPYTLDVVDVPAGLFWNQQTEYQDLLCDVLPTTDGYGRFALYPLVPCVGFENSLEIYNINLQNGEYTLHRSGTLPWDYSCDLTKQHQLRLENVTDEQCDVILNIQQTIEYPDIIYEHSSIRYATIDLFGNSSADDPLVPVAKPSVSVYPNPSRADFSITLKDLPAGEVKAEVFNIRGQKVAEIKDFSPASGTELNGRWQALDANQQRMASGVYLMRIKQSGKVIATKRITVF